MKRLALIAGAAALLAGGATQATLFTDPTGLNDRIEFNPEEVVSFTGSTGEFLSPAVQKVRLEVQPAGTIALLNEPFWNFGENGSWSLGKKFVALDSATGTLSFDFAGQTVAAVGAFVNYYRAFDEVSPSLTIRSYNAAGALIESRTLSFNFGAAPDDINLGVFVGLRGPEPEIFRFTVSGDAVGVDFVGFTTAVPEPSAYAMLLAGLGLLGFAARRARRT